jgi:hypothetical protein
MDEIYTKWAKNIPTFTFKGPPKFTQIGIFGLKIHIPSGNPVVTLLSIEEKGCYVPMSTSKLSTVKILTQLLKMYSSSDPSWEPPTGVR